MHYTPLALLLPLCLVACGPSDNDPGPGGVTVGEARALDEAAQMLDRQTAPENPAADQGEGATPAE